MLDKRHPDTEGVPSAADKDVSNEGKMLSSQLAVTNRMYDLGK